MDKQFYVYAHCRPDGMPFYIGKGHGRRSHDLLPSAKRNQHHKNTVKKHGKENIIIEVMPCKSEAEALLREQLAIKALRTAGIELCNLTDGGEGVSGYKHSSEVLAEFSVVRKGNKHLLGWVPTDETRALWSAQRKGNQYGKGYKHSEETRAKMVIARVGKTPAKGYFPPDEVKKKISDALKAKWQEPSFIAKMKNRTPRNKRLKRSKP